MTIDLLREMPHIIGEIGLEAADLPSPSVLCKAFDRISMSVCRVLLRQSAQLHDPSKHGALDATFYERDRASRHYCHRTNYHVQTLKVTKLVDTDTQAVLDVHCSTTLEGSDADLCGHLPLTRVTIRKRYLNTFVTSIFDRSSNTVSSHRTTTPTTPESTKNCTLSAR